MHAMHGVWLALAVLGAAGCGRQVATVAQPAVAIAADDTSVGCGMAIAGAPGPRAEAYLAGQPAPLKFGSVRDFFAFILQPENRHQLGQLYVQDMAGADWRRPPSSPRSFIDARTAYYVAWQPLAGMMGPTFASFASAPAAADFVRRHGGQVVRFDDVDAALTAALDTRCPAPGSTMHARFRACAAGSGMGLAAPATGMPGMHAGMAGTSPGHAMSAHVPH